MMAMATSGMCEPLEAAWPALAQACEAGILCEVDVQLATLILGEKTAENEQAAAFICHMSLASRAGSLCVVKEEGQLLPSPWQLWLDGGKKAASDRLLALLSQLEKEELPPLSFPVVKEGGRYYFQKSWQLETLFLSHFQAFLSHLPAVQIEQTFVEEKGRGHQLNKEQQAAILSCCGSCLVMITGGPGTGKTYTAGRLMRIFWESLTEDERSRYEIALAAPTGKAASNLEKSLQKAFSGDEALQKKFKAKTLHSLLGFNPYSRAQEKPQNKLAADLVIVDESSMIDIRLFSQLFASMKPGARLVLLGDACQLPPVESGSVFHDLVTYYSHASPKNYAVSELKQCLRAELAAIVDFSDRIKRADEQGVLAYLHAGLPQGSGVARRDLGSAGCDDEAFACLLNLCTEEFAKVGTHASQQDLTALLNSYNAFRLLSPLRHGKWGVNALNRLIHEKLVDRVKSGFFYAAPLMICANDYRRGLFNGEVGVLFQRKTPHSFFEMEDFAVFFGDCGQEVRKIPALLLPKFEYAYCLSVHKSQGSEFDRVLLVLPPGSEAFGREVFYTAATRAKKNLEIAGADETLRMTLQHQSRRFSGIIPRLSCRG